MRVRPKSVWRAGLSSKDGKLYRFDHRRIVVMAPWPDPRAWFRTPTKAWQPTRKWADRVLSNMTIPSPSRELIDLGFDSTSRWLTSNMREQVAQTKYLSAVPPEIQAELSLLTERRWQAMNLFARVPGGLELYRSNPGLAFCLANNWAFHRPAVTHPYRSARSLVGKKQREIVGWLGFPPTDAVVRILGKVQRPALSARKLLLLRKAIADNSTMKVISHLECINQDVLELTTRERFRRLVAPRLLMEVGANQATLPPAPSDRSQSVVRTLWDTLALGDLLGGRCLPRRFERLSHLQDTHDRLMEISNRRAAERESQNCNDTEFPVPPFLRTCKSQNYDGMDFPPPPFPGTADIVPVQFPASLAHEGIAMGHCVGSYVERVVRGRTYVYRVFRPVQATLSIVRGSDGFWRAGEVSGPRNCSIDAAVALRLFQDLFCSPSTARVVDEILPWP